MSRFCDDRQKGLCKECAVMNLQKCERVYGNFELFGQS